MKYSLFPIILIIILIGCTGGNMSENGNYSEQKLTVSDIETLETSKIYFAHQSVGYNILDGVNDVFLNYDKTFNIVETSKISEYGSSFFAHSTVGQNTRPETKIKEFSDNINNGIGESVDIALLKLCYVDINVDTDVNSLFTDYKKTMDSLDELFPDTLFVHSTVPLMSQQKGIKPFIKKIIGKQVWGYEDNLRRQEYNELLRSEYSSKGTLFDIAKIESTKPDGSRNVHSLDGKEYFSMVSEYTLDGGHLNEKGSILVAEKLIKFMAEIKTKEYGY